LYPATADPTHRLKLSDRLCKYVTFRKFFQTLFESEMTAFCL